jgi:hypothetical protein
VIRKFCNLFKPRNRIVFGRDTQPLVRRQRIQATSPGIRVLETANGVELGLDMQTVYNVAQKATEADHPWRLSRSLPGTACRVSGGEVYTGQETIPVSGISGSVPTSGDHYWWLRLRYPNQGTGQTATGIIEEGSSLPDADFQTDEIPEAQPCDPTTFSGWCEVIVPLAKSASGNVSQLMHSNLYIPRGFTVSVDRVVSVHWEDNKLQYAIATDTYVNGVLTETTSASCEDIFSTGDCPDTATEEV